MHSTIVYDRPGRLRLRCGQYAFDQRQAPGIEALLMGEMGVEQVTACSTNGSILVLYRGTARARILERVAAIRRDTIPAAPQETVQGLQEIDDWFWNRFAWMVVRRALFRFILPSPIRMAVTLIKALGYGRAGLHSLFRGRMDVSVLDAASIGAAIAQGSYATASSVMFLLSLSGLLEEYTRRRTGTALRQSLTIHVDQVWRVEENGREESIPMASLQVGEKIRIRCGSLIPVDGKVTDGDGMVNEAAMTGEPLAVHKRPGSVVYAGTTMEEGTLTVEVTALSGESRISQIVEMIEESENLKAGVQSRAEHLADAIVPLSFLGALGVGAVTRSLTKALSVLMVDYSCAIKLSTPIAVISAMREAATHKLMVKGGKYLEAFARADTMIFDKTGTLTAACPQVTKVIPLAGYSRDQVLRIAACIEEHFPHSMARAVVQKAVEENLQHEERHAQVEYVVAHGVATQLYGQRALIGSYHFIFEDEQIPFPQEEKELVERETAGSSALYLAIGGQLAGVICISDPPRPEAAQAIQELRELGIRQVVMLTGDHENAARSACRQMGISQYRAQVLPDEKAALVARYKEGSAGVIMVGDGINDSPALAAADVSVAMKDSSDLAREVADITLLSADLRDLAVLRRLSRRMLERIDRNYRTILSFNTALLLLGLGGVLRPTTTAMLHNLSTMAIAAGSMRLYLKEEDGKRQTKQTAHPASRQGSGRRRGSL